MPKGMAYKELLLLLLAAAAAPAVCKAVHQQFLCNGEAWLLPFTHYTGAAINTLLLLLLCSALCAMSCMYQVIQADLNTSPQLVAASVAIYMVLVGLGSLVWGPASDRWAIQLQHLQK
jgi:hypothetical protein